MSCTAILVPPPPPPPPFPGARLKQCLSLKIIKRRQETHTALTSFNPPSPSSFPLPAQGRKIGCRFPPYSHRPCSHARRRLEDFSPFDIHWIKARRISFLLSRYLFLFRQRTPYPLTPNPSNTNAKFIPLKPSRYVSLPPPSPSPPPPPSKPPQNINTLLSFARFQ